jgi:hypothetical protein
VHLFNHYLMANTSTSTIEHHALVPGELFYPAILLQIRLARVADIVVQCDNQLVSIANFIRSQTEELCHHCPFRQQEATP